MIQITDCGVYTNIRDYNEEEKKEEEPKESSDIDDTISL